MLNSPVPKLYIRSLIFLIILYLPTNLWADCQITLQWEANTDPQVYYQLFYRQYGTNYDYDNFVWQGSDNQFTVAGLDETKIYYFVVRAIDGQGNQIGDSVEAVFSYGDTPTDPGSSGGSSAGLSTGGGSSGGGSGGGCFIQTLLNP